MGQFQQQVIEQFDRGGAELHADGQRIHRGGEAIELRHEQADCLGPRHQVQQHALVRLELVDVDADGNVALRQRPFLARASFGDRLVPLAENLEDHAEAAVSNVLGHEPPFLERSVFSDELSEESAARLHELVKQRWKEIHDELVAQAIALEQQDKEAGKATASRIRMGMYFYSQTKDPE